MTIRKKTIIIIIALIVISSALWFGGAFFVVNSRFTNLEEENTKKNLERVTDAYSAQIENLALKAADWAQWDDTYRFVQDGNQAYIDSNLVVETFTNLKIDLMMFIDASGKRIYAQSHDARTGKERPLPDSREYLSSDSMLFKHTNTKSIVKGTILLEEGPIMLVVSRPVLTSEGGGPIKGTLVFGQYLDDHDIKALSDLTHVPLDITKFNVASADKSEDKARQLLADNPESEVIDPVNNKTVSGYKVIKDILGEPDLLLRIDIQRSIFQQGQLIILYLAFQTILIGVPAGVGIIIFLNRQILSRLHLLAYYAPQIGSSGSLKARLPVSGNDEITKLETSINQMLESLQDSQAERLETEKKLQNRTKQLESQNKSLEDTKTALLNVLEDTQKLEGEIKEQSDQVQAIISSMGEGVFVVDKNYLVVQINPAAEKILGTLSKKVTGQDLRKIVSVYKSEKKIPDGERPLAKALKKGESMTAGLEADMYLETISGRKFPVAFATSPLRGEGITGAVVVFRDITAEKELKNTIEKQVEERTLELSEEQTKLQASINSLNVGFIMTDIKHDVLLINSTAKRILCVGDYDTISPGAVTDPSIMNIKCDMDEIETQLKDVLDIKKEIEKSIKDRKTVEIKDLAFKNLYLHLFMTPIVMTGERLRVIGAVIIIEDITAGKLLEKTREDFFAVAAHDLRTPLTAIRGNSSLITQYFSDQLKDQGLREMVSDIHESSVRLIGLVNDYLDVAKIEQGKVEFDTRPIDLTGLVKETIEQLMPTAANKGLSLEVTESDLPLVLADKNRLTQVVFNLVGNAIKFTKKGRVTISFKKEAGFLKTLVKDTGSGISKNNQLALFKKFGQVGENPLTRDTTKGTGLGLYISKLLIEGMGGTIYLEKSGIGKGSTFIFRLPLVKG